jgi:hypothetical protein
MSKEKFSFLLYQSLLPDSSSSLNDTVQHQDEGAILDDDKNRKYLLTKYSDFVIESAKLGAKDNTFAFGDDKKWQTRHDNLIELAKQERAAELAYENAKLDYEKAKANMTRGKRALVYNTIGDDFNDDIIL